MKCSGNGFTLIELSIVLVIIGLIIGGILTGQDLIRSAGERATISQIEKYNQAVNTFVGKYGYIPGDMPDPPASSFGFITPRVNTEGEGNGNGILSGNGFHDFGEVGETGVFWVDLATAKLIDGGFNTANEIGPGIGVVNATTTPNLNAFLPPAKIGNGNYIYVYDGSPTSNPTGSNYYGLSAVSAIYSGWIPASTPGLTVKQAYDIDQKVDDGMPQSGGVVALYLNFNLQSNCASWAAGGGVEGANSIGNCTTHGPTTGATVGSATTCYDNSASPTGAPGVAGTNQHYSVEMSNGANMNCALSFKFQ